MLTNSEKTEIAKIYSATCKTFDKIIEPDTMRMLVDDLQDLSFEQIITALNIFRRDQKNLYWPRANKIRALVNPELSKEGMANEVTSRIREAVSKFGWSNSEDSKNYIGSLGWDIIQRQGGWQYICEHLGLELNISTYTAQTRDLAKAMIESAELGKYNQPIQIPEKGGQQKIKSVLNLITFKEIPK